MDNIVKQELDYLRTLNPTNIHLETNIKTGLRASFESLWYRHGPEAARLSILPYLHDGRLKQKCEVTNT